MTLSLPFLAFLTWDRVPHRGVARHGSGRRGSGAEGVAAGFWSIVEAHGSKKASTESEAVGYAVGLFTWVLAGGVFVAAKGAIDEMPPWTLCFWRLLIATAILLPFVRHQFRGRSGASCSAHGLSAFIIGALGFAFTQGLMFTALEHTSAVNAGIVFATNPIITLVLAHFVLREAMSPWQVLGSLIALGGIVVIAVKGSLAILLGLDRECRRHHRDCGGRHLRRLHGAAQARQV